MNRLEKLKEVMSIQSVSRDTKKMNKYLRRELLDIKGVEYYENDGNFYATKGSADYYPCIVAHTDTVHRIIKDFRVFQVEDKLMAINYTNGQRAGIGGDDKVGIFVALELLKILDCCKVAFFRDEEIGCAGSLNADMAFFENVGYMFQCDRKGKNDFISDIYGVELYSIDFFDKVMDLMILNGKNEEYGALTDVYQLVMNGYNGSVTNLSCGYYHPHTDNEYIVISEVFNVIKFVEDCICALGYNYYEVDRDSQVKYEDTYNYSNDWGYYLSDKVYDKKSYKDVFEDDFKDDYKKPYKTTGLDDSICSICGDDDLILDDYDNLHYCFTCQEYVSVEKQL